jgi:hypothetical protein
LKSFVCAALPSSIHTTGFQWGSSPETEIAIAKWWFSLWILMCAWGYGLAGRSTCGQVSAFWQRQPGFWLKCHDTWYKIPRTSESKIVP